MHLFCFLRFGNRVCKVFCVPRFDIGIVVNFHGEYLSFYCGFCVLCVFCGICGCQVRIPRRDAENGGSRPTGQLPKQSSYFPILGNNQEPNNDDQDANFDHRDSPRFTKNPDFSAWSDFGPTQVRNCQPGESQNLASVSVAS